MVLSSKFKLKLKRKGDTTAVTVEKQAMGLYVMDFWCMR